MTEKRNGYRCAGSVRANAISAGSLLEACVLDGVARELDQRQPRLLLIFSAIIVQTLACALNSEALPR